MLHLTVESIQDVTDYPHFEIVIVDDGSTDGSCARYSDAGASVKLISSENLGVARARNLGAKHARGEFLVYLDAHCTVQSDWLDRFVDALAPRDIGVVGPSFTQLTEPQPRGCGNTWISHALETSWFEPWDGQEVYEVPLTPGGCHAVRTENFYAIGQYDEGFFRWGSEDHEYCLRSWLLGYRVLVDSSISIAHDFRTTRNFEVPDDAVLYNFLRLIHLHFSKSRIDRCLHAIAGYPNLESSLEQIYASDVFEVRKEMEDARVYDDNWYFNVFMPQLA